MLKIKMMVSMSELVTIQLTTYYTWTWLWPLETVDLILSSNVLDSAPQVARAFNKKIMFHNILRLDCNCIDWSKVKCVAELIPHASCFQVMRIREKTYDQVKKILYLKQVEIVTRNFNLLIYLQSRHRLKFPRRYNF